MFKRLFVYCFNANKYNPFSVRPVTFHNLLECSILVAWPWSWRCMSVLHSNTEANDMSTLETLRFDNLVLRTLPVDPVAENYVRTVQGACFSRVKPTCVDKPSLVAVSQSALDLLDIPPSEVERKDFVEYFSGNKLLPGSETAAHCYCGHQFGYFSGQLGDGAAMYLGEIKNKKDERWEIQLKGSGKTPYSRTADGRKVLRSSIREFLCSEAMYHLGVPTSRAGSCITSESTVIRDLFYDGNPANEKCTIVLRIAPTFIRFGSFEIFKTLDDMTRRTGPSVGRNDILFQLLDYTIQTFYPEIWEKHKEDKQKMYIEMYKEVIRRTARLVAEWQCVGWCHGVLNTDNMSIVGITIDYGPFGFMDRYDPDFVCNASDDGCRYTYKNQPDICKWNCMKLGEAIQAAVPLSETKQHLDMFDDVYSSHMKQKLRKKFGLLKKQIESDKDLYESFLDTLHKTGADYTNSFRCLSDLPLPSSADFEHKLTQVKEYLLSQCTTLEEMRMHNKTDMDPRQMQSLLSMLQLNPALMSMMGRQFASLTRDLEKQKTLKQLEKRTEEDQRKMNEEALNTWLKTYVERLQKEVDGSTDLPKANADRKRVMNANNPRFILRNYMAQNAIQTAEKGDYSEVRQVLKLLEHPYSDTVILDDLPQQTVSLATDDNVSHGESSQASLDEKGCELRSYTGTLYDSKPPDWSADLRVT